ncbi:hypothetical protein N4T57_06285 [Campylobacter hepaticus]|nr:hypothetical protein [Campylobacter hepaticus]MCZ0771708.1 hypothetical protein [Campylobacter hepaticus]MCZ0772528.1 hypothetical protein [Campylobacter hepaticus]MCZ0772739.1 hypothetical protein [Campylobacter hepaticus]MCZ0773177.1 hypothetical protein [Campylobacter hepaticus]MCZ0773996.1 hypothetical protein [Campylobacter hepaticus]
MKIYNLNFKVFLLEARSNSLIIKAYDSCEIVEFNKEMIEG